MHGSKCNDNLFPASKSVIAGMLDPPSASPITCTQAFMTWRLSLPAGDYQWSPASAGTHMFAEGTSLSSQMRVHHIHYSIDTESYVPVQGHSSGVNVHLLLRGEVVAYCAAYLLSSARPLSAQLLDVVVARSHSEEK